MKRFFTFALAVCILCTFMFTTVSALEFNDVASSDSYYEAVTALSDCGVIYGRGEGLFDPLAKTTRAEFCAFLARAKGLYTQKAEEKAPFTDVPEGYWAENAIAQCYAMGYVNGTGGGLFEPARTITYEEAAKMVVVASGIGDTSLTDVGPKWYDGYITRGASRGLFQKIEFKLGEDSPRHYIAQLIYNGMAQDSFLDDVKEETEESPTVTPTVTPSPTPETTPETSPEATPLPIPSYPLAEPGQLTVVIDAGHNASGGDTGATFDGAWEQDITWEISTRVSEILRENGIHVIETRPEKTDNLGTNTNDSLKIRVAIANEYNADLFVSIHVNSGGGFGTETYIISEGGEAEKLAKMVQAYVSRDLERYDRGVRTANFYVIKYTDMPAVLIETGFLDNEEDFQLLTTEEGWEGYAESVSKAVLYHLGLYEDPEMEEYLEALQKKAEEERQALLEQEASKDKDPEDGEDSENTEASEDLEEDLEEQP